MAINKLARVVLWMVGTLLSFSVMAVSIRELATGLSMFEILAIRSGVALLVLLVLLAVRPDLRVHALPRRMKLNLLRNSVHYASQFAWALSITILPLGVVFALEFTMPGYAITMITTKQLTMTKTTFGIVFWMAVIDLPLSLIGGGDPMVFFHLETRHILPAIGGGTAGLTRTIA